MIFCLCCACLMPANVSHFNRAFQVQANYVLSEFCRISPAAQVVPRPFELDCLWLQCARIPPAAVSASIQQVLSFEDGIPEWQPRLRALHALLHIIGKGGTYGEAACEAASEMRPLLNYYFTEFPQCRDIALKVLASLNDEMSAHL
eukprot:TRINITY_DN16130_c0_g1_i3.p1 TRINITY_DN16130_c0_g1~~TRINITY_DN16130_c0_g1_i3.p1  ORF type:complete len:146 (+),score=21.14 TRINITY_DN16130_c0_g1_i3:119-556(+)